MSSRPYRLYRVTAARDKWGNLIKFYLGNYSSATAIQKKIKKLGTTKNRFVIENTGFDVPAAINIHTRHTERILLMKKNKKIAA